MNVLFICNQNKHRSKTAEDLFRNKFNTRSAGLYGGSLVNNEILSWADIVFVMEEEQRYELSKRFPKEYLLKRIINLNIPDTFLYNSPELKKMLEIKVSSLI